MNHSEPFPPPLNGVHRQTLHDLSLPRGRGLELASAAQSLVNASDALTRSGSQVTPGDAVYARISVNRAIESIVRVQEADDGCNVVLAPKQVPVDTRLKLMKATYDRELGFVRLTIKTINKWALVAAFGLCWAFPSVAPWATPIAFLFALVWTNSMVKGWKRWRGES